ncbi:dentin sialophosphoprotein [Esox lucius]|uniref:dentin sialophosphoprotein n=1 Tax=Esox lucius TaxID=8010 RepID=UPI0014769DFD|nr:dentin sialophosphoprotein [Esox lucius]
MKLLLCFLSVLALVAVVVTVPIEDRSQDVINFLNGFVTGALNAVPFEESTSSREINAGPENTFGKPDTNPARPSDSRPTENSAEISDVTQSSNFADLTDSLDSDAQSKENGNSDDTDDDDYQISKGKITRTEMRKFAQNKNSAGSKSGEKADVVVDVTTVSPSAEGQVTTGSKGTDSPLPSDLGKYTQHSSWMTVDPDHVDNMQTTTGQKSTNQSEELSNGIQRARGGREGNSRELTDPHSEETPLLGCQGVACVSQQLGTRGSRGEMKNTTSPDSSDFQIQVVTGTATGQALCKNSHRSVVNDVLETSGRQQDLDSLENVSGESIDLLTDDVSRGETREYVSTERNPAVLGQLPGTPARTSSVPEPSSR